MRGEGKEEKGEERGGRRRKGRGGLSGNVAEEDFCLKSAPEGAPRFGDNVQFDRVCM